VLVENQILGLLSFGLAGTARLKSNGSLNDFHAPHGAEITALLCVSMQM
jgi:hypothetical protein